MSIRNVAYASCIAAMLLLGGCVLDTAGGGGDDGPLGTGSWELATDQEVLPPQGVDVGTVDQQGSDDAQPGDDDESANADDTADPTPANRPSIRPDQVDEPHPDPWMSVDPLNGR